MRGVLILSAVALSAAFFMERSPLGDDLPDWDPQTVAGLSNITQSIGADLPKHFDSREAFPKCDHRVFNQGACGSCWAFAGATTLSYSFCAQSNQRAILTLSPQNLLSCGRWNIRCKMGELPMFALKYLKDTGITLDTCVPYVSGNGTVPKCTTKDLKCTAPGERFAIFRAADYTHIGSFINPKGHTEAIMRAIMTRGAVDVTFNLYGDFQQYRGGIYKHSSGGYQGLHSVTMIGWGEEGGVPYWIVQNSWGSSWGENGYFRIIRGKDECSIERLVYGVTAAL